MIAELRFEVCVEPFKLAITLGFKVKTLWFSNQRNMISWK